MFLFETILALLLGAIALSTVAKRINIPYPTLLALGGVAVAFLPGAPRLDMPADLILALFVAPVLLDAAYDTSLRDIRRNWLPILSLVVVAVGVTTVSVAIVARLFFPDFPWPAAIALGALLAPPDAVAALAVLRQVDPPHRIRMVLEGESLLNDASSLLVYRAAVGAVATGAFDVSQVVPGFALVLLGSVAVGWLLAWPVVRLTNLIEDAPSAIVAQFVLTFAVWILAERLGLSAVVTMVVFGLTMARGSSPALSARLRLPSFAIWQSVTMVLNVLAFTLIGLQIHPIVDSLSHTEKGPYLLGALAILATVILARIAWVVTHHIVTGWARRLMLITDSRSRADLGKGALVIGWSGMRGIVTLAAAMALPLGFPYRDFIQLVAFVVVLGTLVIQGSTLQLLLQWLRLPEDMTVQSEVDKARVIALEAALNVLKAEGIPEADRLHHEYCEALMRARGGQNPRNSQANALRRRVVVASHRGRADAGRRHGFRCDQRPVGGALPRRSADHDAGLADRLSRHRAAAHQFGDASVARGNASARQFRRRPRLRRHPVWRRRHHRLPPPAHAQAIWTRPDGDRQRRRSRQQGGPAG